MSETAMLILDMPSKCGECIFKTLHPEPDKTYCCGLLVYLQDYTVCVDEYDFLNSVRPYWCPLCKMPEKNTLSYFPDEYMDGHRDGHNACIDEILRRKKR